MDMKNKAAIWKTDGQERSRFGVDTFSTGARETGLMNNDKRFDLDLQYGQVFEKKVADMLQNSKIEVKTEREKWKSTGNIVIEFESRGKPSGIATTEAEYWFHNLALGEDIVMTLVIPTKILKNYIAQTMPRIVSGGDNNTSRLYLLNLQSLVKMINVCA
jgi:hypothetical protein